MSIITLANRNIHKELYFYDIQQISNTVKMKNEEKLYDVLGELLYGVAKADGVIQEEEKDALKNLLHNHPYGTDIMWSFEYEEKKDSTVDDIYNKVINYCHGYGPSPIYIEFIDNMKVIAEAANGIQDKESEMIQSFSKDLLERFQKDAEKLALFHSSLED